MSTPTDATLNELRERVIAAHRQRRPLHLRGAGTKDFYGADTSDAATGVTAIAPSTSDPGAPSASARGTTPSAATNASRTAPPGTAASAATNALRDVPPGTAASAATIALHAHASFVADAPSGVPLAPAPTGGGNRQRDTVAPADTLDLRAYRGIVDYEPSELVITARCGTPLSEIESALADRGQFLAFEPPGFGGDPTVGGVIAAGLSGPRRMYAGAARDFVLGANLLDARGEILRFGGQVMKNVAGFDVSRLLCGSLGILGVITEVSLKVLPLPRAEETVRFEMSPGEAVEAFNRWSGQPLPLSAAAWYDGVAWLRLSGAASAVRAAHENLGGERADAASAQTWWNSLRHCTHPIFNSPTVWRLSVPDTAPPLDLPGDLLIDWGGALRWYAHRDIDDTVSPRRAAIAASGTALCWRGPTPTGGRFHPLQPAIATLHRRLKDRFDPHGIFNPGRMIAGL